MRGIVFSLMASLCAGGAFGQSAVPDHRYTVQQDVDFFGADRTALFDTTFEACARACSADAACVAFTFNDRSRACFPKAQITERKAYVGARSATRFATPDRIKSRATDRAALLPLATQDIEAARSFAFDIGLRVSLAGERAGGLLFTSPAACGPGGPAAGLRWAGMAVARSDAAHLRARDESPPPPPNH
ncbi:MAG: PAN/Apple domain-containing protein, partial [Tateyamaria sp.]